MFMANEHSYTPSDPLSLFMHLFPNFRPFRAIKHYWPKVLNGHKKVEFLSNQNSNTRDDLLSPATFFFLDLEPFKTIKYFFLEVFDVTLGQKCLVVIKVSNIHNYTTSYPLSLIMFLFSNLSTLEPKVFVGPKRV